LEPKNIFINDPIELKGLREYKESLTEEQLRKFEDDIGTWFFWNEVYKLFIQPRQLRHAILFYKYNDGEENDK